MTKRPEARYVVDFQVFLTWQTQNGVVQRVVCHCVNLSPSGAKLETRDRLEARSSVLVHSEHFGRMGLASIRYCVRQGMKYEVGLQFNSPFSLSDPVRKEILDRVLLRDKPAGTVAPAGKYAR